MSRQPPRPDRPRENPHGESYRHPTYLTPRGLLVTALIAGLLPVVVFTMAAPEVVGAALVGGAAGFVYGAAERSG